MISARAFLLYALFGLSLSFGADARWTAECHITIGGPGSIRPDNVVARPQDVAAFDLSAGTASVFSTIGSGASEADGFERVDNDTFYYSLNVRAEQSGTTIHPTDVVPSDAVNLTFALNADAAGVLNGIDLDAVTPGSEGNVAVTVSSSSAGGNVDDGIVLWSPGVAQAIRNCTEIGTNFCGGNTTCP